MGELSYMCYSHRRVFAQLVAQLIQEGKKDKALAALNYAEKMIPDYNVPYDWQNGATQMAEAYYQLGKQAQGDEIIKAMANKAVEYITCAGIVFHTLPGASSVIPI